MNLNIEMIGRYTSHKNAFFLTGAKGSTLADIFRKNLQSTAIRLEREPNEAKQLYERSDNYSFARKGVVAHSFMASDDDDPCYHQPCDELRTIDIRNMTLLIQGITTAMTTIVSGADTPTAKPSRRRGK